MTAGLAPAPRSSVLEAGQTRQAGDAGSADAIAVYDDTRSTPVSPYQTTWFRCPQCCQGFFAASAPGPQACPACVGGRLVPVVPWDLAREALPSGMLHRGEGYYAHLG